MFRRSWLFGAMMVSTAVIPYLVSTSNGVQQWVMSKIPARASGEHTADPIALTPTTTTTTTTTTATPEAPAGTVTKTRIARREDVPTHPLEEVLQFNVTTTWIQSEWPRVSADLAELDMHGYRVPLVSGTTDNDVAGSLTYYFNAKQEVARITFFGTTGDPRRLIALLESKFKFQHMQTKEPNLYLYQVTSWGKPTSEMRIRPAKILRSAAPHSRYEIAMVIERPKS